jgi:hypothetical protein
VPQAGTCWASYNPAFTGTGENQWRLGARECKHYFLHRRECLQSVRRRLRTATPLQRVLTDYAIRTFANQDLSISRNFHIREGWRLQFGR